MGASVQRPRPDVKRPEITNVPTGRVAYRSNSTNRGRPAAKAPVAKQRPKYPSYPKFETQRRSRTPGRTPGQAPEPKDLAEERNKRKRVERAQPQRREDA